MKARRFTEAQIISILREAETGQTMIEAMSRKHAIGAATCYRWRSTYGGMDASDAARLKELEREHTVSRKCWPNGISKSR
jgi:putative transposase